MPCLLLRPPGAHDEANQAGEHALQARLGQRRGVEQEDNQGGLPTVTLRPIEIIVGAYKLHDNAMLAMLAMGTPS